MFLRFSCPRTERERESISFKLSRKQIDRFRSNERRQQTNWPTSAASARGFAREEAEPATADRTSWLGLGLASRAKGGRRNWRGERATICRRGASHFRCSTDLRPPGRAVARIEWRPAINRRPPALQFELRPSDGRTKLATELLVPVAVAVAAEDERAPNHLPRARSALRVQVRRPTALLAATGSSSLRPLGARRVAWTRRPTMKRERRTLASRRRLLLAVICTAARLERVLSRRQPTRSVWV